jgi:hypothetical protein
MDAAGGGADAVGAPSDAEPSTGDDAGRGDADAAPASDSGTHGVYTPVADDPSYQLVFDD